MDDDIIENINIIQTRNIKWYHYVGDFANTLKAFIGTNYMALPFGFKQSGLIFGIVSVLLIGALIDYCCQLIIRCKYMIIDQLIEEAHAQGLIDSEEEEHQRRKKLERDLGFGDVGRLALGNWCFHLIQIVVAFTQFTGPVSYFIFIGNVIYTTFPETPAVIPLKNSTHLHHLSSGFIHHHSSSSAALTFKSGARQLCDAAAAIPFLAISSLRHGQCLIDSALPSALDINPSSSLSHGVNKPLSDFLRNSSGNITTTTTPSTPTKPWILPTVSTAPDMRLLLLIPFPIILSLSLIKKLRYLSPFSLIATISLFLGALSMMVYIIKGFHIAKDVTWFVNWLTLPIFLGQMIGALEGIGCILPIEASMEGNRHVFPAFLHGAIFIVCSILITFGVLGYLHYGSTVKQLIILSIEQHTPIAIVIDITLIISVVFTCPLQAFPSIEICESYLFNSNNLACCKSKRKKALSVDDYLVSSSVNADREDLINNEFEASQTSLILPPSVPNWKRNLFRIIFISLSLGLAIVLRNAFVYLSAFTGAVGCSILAYIMPCMIHAKLVLNSSHPCRIPLAIFDVVIIIFATLMSVMTIIIIVQQIVAGDISIG